MAANIGLFRDIVREITLLAEQAPDELAMLNQAESLLEALLAKDNWLPDAFAAPDPDHYRQYLLYCDVKERFSIVSFVWAPGQETPIHDHTVWGLLGVLRGCEVSQRYVQTPDGMQTSGGLDYMESGAIDRVSPRIGDIHKVKNGLNAKPSVSIHLYGGNIGAIERHAYSREGAVKAFRSGYSLDTLPNIW